MTGFRVIPVGDATAALSVLAAGEAQAALCVGNVAWEVRHRAEVGFLNADIPIVAADADILDANDVWRATQHARTVGSVLQEAVSRDRALRTALTEDREPVEGRIEAIGTRGVLDAVAALGDPASITFRSPTRTTAYIELVGKRVLAARVEGADACDGVAVMRRILGTRWASYRIGRPGDGAEHDGDLGELRTLLTEAAAGLVESCEQIAKGVRALRETESAAAYRRLAGSTAVAVFDAALQGIPAVMLAGGLGITLDEVVRYMRELIRAGACEIKDEDEESASAAPDEKAAIEASNPPPPLPSTVRSDAKEAKTKRRVVKPTLQKPAAFEPPPSKTFGPGAILGVPALSVPKPSPAGDKKAAAEEDEAEVDASADDERAREKEAAAAETDAEGPADESGVGEETTAAGEGDEAEERATELLPKPLPAAQIGTSSGMGRWVALIVGVLVVGAVGLLVLLLSGGEEADVSAPAPATSVPGEDGARTGAGSGPDVVPIDPDGDGDSADGAGKKPGKKPGVKPDTKPASTASKEAARKAFSKATNLYLRGKDTAAIALYKKAAALDPSYADPWRGLGFSYARRGKKGPAAKALEKYLRLKPGAGDRASIERKLKEL